MDRIHGRLETQNHLAAPACAAKSRAYARVHLHAHAFDRVELENWRGHNVGSGNAASAAGRRAQLRVMCEAGVRGTRVLRSRSRSTPPSNVGPISSTREALLSKRKKEKQQIPNILRPTRVPGALDCILVPPFTIKLKKKKKPIASLGCEGG